MKAYLSTIIFIFFSIPFFYGQILNQSANWPNTGWNVGGGYFLPSMLNDPRVATNLTFDDDIAGASWANDIFVESPIIDLTQAKNAGEFLITITGDFVFMNNNQGTDFLAIEYWDADLSTWNVIKEFVQNTGLQSDFRNCNINFTYTTNPIDITNFSPTKLAGFKYRIYYDDGGAWQEGWCFNSPTIMSSSCEPMSTPYSEGFENVIPCYSQESGPNYTWTVLTGPTFSVGTGPFAASLPLNPNDVHYIYTDSSIPSSTGDTSRLQTPWIDISGLSNPGLSFEYFMYGSDIGRLIIQVDIGNGYTSVDSIIGQQQSNDFAPWVTKTLNLSNYNGIIRIGFLSIRGAGFMGDVAIDDILVDEVTVIIENEPDLGVKVFPNPTNGRIRLQLNRIYNEELVLEIRDVHGRVVHAKQENILDDYLEKEINLSHLQKGIYFIKVRSGNISRTERFIIN